MVGVFCGLFDVLCVVVVFCLFSCLVYVSGFLVFVFKCFCLFV